MKTIDDYDLDFSAADDATMFGMTRRQCIRVLEDQRNEVVAQRDEALDLLREIVEVSHEHIVTSVLQRARELLKRLEGQ